MLDGLDGSLIKLIDNPEPDINVNFGQGLAVTPAGQIAVGAFGADGGFGRLYLFTSVSAGESLDPLNTHGFNDANLQACVLNTAAANGWATVNEVTALDCASNDITDLTGLEDLTSLQTLDLTDNPGILCSELDALEAALLSTTITRPDPCSTGSGGVQASQVQALHNALGQRVIKTVNGDPNATIHFVYDQAGQVIAEIDATTGATLREYIYVNGQQVAIVDDTGTPEEQTYFVHNDHLGTPQKITDSNQAIVWNATYKPFGKVEVTTADIENHIRFPGQYADEETGLHYNYFRDYDPSLGRYVESDPIGLEGGINSFAYVENSPITSIDPVGQVKWEGNITYASRKLGPKIRGRKINVFEGSIVQIDVTTGCINGQKGSVGLRVLNPNNEFKLRSPVIYFSASLTLNDSEENVNAGALVGPFEAHFAGNIFTGKGGVRSGRGVGNANGPGLAGHVKLSGIANHYREPIIEACGC